MSRYVRGEIARISATFAIAGTPTDPTAVTITVTDPAGVTSSPAPSHDGPGAYHADVVAATAGRWRYRIAGTGAAAGVYEGSFDVLESPYDDLITPAQVRAAKASTVSDEVLQIWIDAATQAIIKRFGPVAPVQERHRGGGLHVWLARPAASVTSVIEAWGDPVGLGNTTLDPGDYLLLPNRTGIRRLNTGAHLADVWGDFVDVTYLPLDDTAERQRVVIALVKLDIAHNPGVTAENVGEWGASYADNSVMNYAVERETILSSLAIADFA